MPYTLAHKRTHVRTHKHTHTHTHTHTQTHTHTHTHAHTHTPSHTQVPHTLATLAATVPGADRRLGGGGGGESGNGHTSMRWGVSGGNVSYEATARQRALVDPQMQQTATPCNTHCSSTHCVIPQVLILQMCTDPMRRVCLLLPAPSPTPPPPSSYQPLPTHLAGSTIRISVHPKILSRGEQQVFAQREEDAGGGDRALCGDLIPASMSPHSTSSQLELFCAGRRGRDSRP